MATPSLPSPMAYAVGDDVTRLRSVVRTSFHLFGGLHLLRAATRSTVRILMYHRFSERAAGLFRVQCEHLARNYRVISLSALAEARRAGRSLPPNAAIITVDDGYRDFFHVAWPILQEFGLTATVFLVSDFVERRSWLPGDRLEYAVTRTPLETAGIETPAGKVIRVNLANAQQRHEAVWRLKNAAKSMPAQTAAVFVDDAARQLGVDVPDLAPRMFEPMTQAEAKMMAANGIEFGAHTQTHPILTRVETLDMLRNEIAGSKRDLEAWLDASVRHFCYPNGDYDDRSVAVVRDSGYETAVTTELGLNRAGTDCLLMRRIGVEPYMLPVTFRHFVAGTLANVMEGA